MQFNRALVEKYDRPGPRYTSYPTAPQFHCAFSAKDYEQQARASNIEPAKPLSIYLHVPFCQSLCYYCACHKIVTQKTQRAAQYLDYLLKEIALKAPLFTNKRLVTQLHLGGGTPTYFTSEQLARLMSALNNAFKLDHSDSREFSLEVDPRTLDVGQIHTLKALGFNRLSFGVQDFDLKVQQAINRVQSIEQTTTLVDASRLAGFKSVSIDLIYGLPLQSVASFNRTLEQVIALRPDRIAAYSYAHMPHLVRAQRLIRPEDMPAPELKLELLELTINRLTQAGYIYIGMDHFALPNDGLTLARQRGTLQRNFQGYSTQAQCDLIGLGVSSIGKFQNSYSQNTKELKSYYQALDQAQIPISKGYTLDQDDLVRSTVITQLMCHGTLEFAEIERDFAICFSDYFADELVALETLASDQLLKLSQHGITLTQQGLLLVRNVAMVFDRYLRENAKGQFSRTV